MERPAHESSLSVQHRGIVESVDDGRVTVVVEPQSACAGCHARGFCGEKGETRTITVETPYAKDFVVGERVIVALLSNKMAISSVVWGYLAPLVVLLATLFAAKGLGFADGTSAISSIVAIAIYYVVLYLLRRTFDKKIKFTIIKEQ